MAHHRILRLLRIAVSAVFGILCLLLIALWVRSYYRLDTVGAWSSHTVSSMKGRLVIDGRFFTDERHGERSVFPNAGTSIRIGSGAAALKSQPVGTPIWFLTFCLATLTSATWLPWIKWHFSLRTLLLAMTFVAVVLGLVVALR
jgi:hypothetical protein